MSRALTTHQVNQVNQALTVTVLDAPGAGGASHAYLVHGAAPWENAAFQRPDSHWPDGDMLILFQNGPPAVVGVNGITNEVLLAILIDRTAGFQNGPYACTENQEGLTALMAAQDAFTRRTNERRTRGVEGQLRA